MVEKLTPEKRRERTRTALLEAAEEVFALRGFEGASLDEIAEAAGYTRGAIYPHFKNKDELILAVADRFDQLAVEGFRADIEIGSSLAEMDPGAIATTWQRMLGSGSQSKAVSLEFRLYAMRRPDVRERFIDRRQRSIDQFEQFIDTELANLGVRLTTSSRTLAEIMYAASDGIAHLALLDPSADDLFEPLIDMVIRALMTAVEPIPSDEAPG